MFIRSVHNQRFLSCSHVDYSNRKHNVSVSNSDAGKKNLGEQKRIFKTVTYPILWSVEDMAIE